MSTTKSLAFSDGCALCDEVKIECNSANFVLKSEAAIAFP